MVTPLPLVVERPRRFPVAVEDELARRRARLVRRARGRVLDLGEPSARAEVARAAAERQVVPAYDTVVSVGELVRFPDLVAALVALDRLLVPDGELSVVEPVGRPGVAALLGATVWARSPWTRGFHLARDLTAALRATSFELDDIERFTVPTVVSPLRHAVEVRAVRSPVAVPLAAERQGASS